MGKNWRSPKLRRVKLNISPSDHELYRLRLHIGFRRYNLDGGLCIQVGMAVEYLLVYFRLLHFHNNAYSIGLYTMKVILVYSNGIKESLP